MTKFRSLGAMQRGLGGNPHERLHQDNVRSLMRSAIHPKTLYSSL
ncbi:hypothetical protein [Moorena sp. SIO4G3]|nr:hypothetical protein [Moorena sp. SIO4G3]